MDWVWSLVLHCAAIGAGAAFYSWLLTYDPGRQSDGSSSCYPDEGPR